MTTIARSWWQEDQHHSSKQLNHQLKDHKHHIIGSMAIARKLVPGAATGGKRDQGLTKVVVAKAVMGSQIITPCTGYWMVFDVEPLWLDNRLHMALEHIEFPWPVTTMIARVFVL
jgi:hypothetical protein